MYFIEAGLILIVAPWSPFWERNFFASSVPVMASVFASPFVRGGVSGIGAVTALAGLAEIGGAFGAWRLREHTSDERLNAGH